jgi:hypothetical protein
LAERSQNSECFQWWSRGVSAQEGSSPDRNPNLTPADIRRILTASARRLGSADRDDDFGSGLIDPLKALQLADPRIVSTAPPSAPTPTPASAPAGTPSPTLRQR